MKKILLTLAAFIISAMAFSQTPTTTKEENLKGDVYFVRHLFYQYLENFGEPKEGERIGWKDYYFDDQGRGILFMSNSDKQYYLVRYKQDGENTIAGLLDFAYPRFDKDGYAVLDDCHDDFYSNYHEITYNSDNIVIKHDKFNRGFPIEKYVLISRLTAKPVGDIYECKMYGSRGNTILDFKEKYDSKGHLTVLDNKEGDGTWPIMIPHAGIYQYDAKGRLISLERQDSSHPDKYEYVYNEHDDIKELYFGKINKGENRKLELLKAYEDYKYDDKGNWIYRTVNNRDGKKVIIEKREIQYCNSKEDFESRMNVLYAKFPVVDMKAAEDFSIFHEKYLDGKTFSAKLPLSVYDPNVSIKDADKCAVFVVVSFFSNYCHCNYSLYIFGPGVSKDIKEERDYKYKDGKLIMNNEVYEIDTLTGVLKNITRGYSFIEGLQ